jgi:alcohol dehydrogenase YqhD (iron-dependent ADH family)
MENFVAYNPVKLHFGKGVVDTLGNEATQYGMKALLMYGKGSSVRNGYYDKVLKQLKGAGIEVIEYSGINQIRCTKTWKKLWP